MDVEPDVTRIARTIGEPTRIRMLTLLMEGRALTAKELAHGTGVEPATATTHLQRLLADSLVLATAQGRHKYFRIASPQVAHCVEGLLAIAVPVKSSPLAVPPAMHRARFCYDHLAGKLAVQITEALLKRKLLVLKGREFVLTAAGQRWCVAFGIDVGAVNRTRRKFATVCLDWSERKDHLGGALGAALAQRMIDSGWVKRGRETRSVSVSAKGAEAFAREFGITWS